MRHRVVHATAVCGAVCGLLSGLVAAPSAFASPTVTALPDASAASAAALAASLVTSGGGVTVVAGSASYTGQASASGTFTNGGVGATGLGIDRGVVLTSGDARFIGSSAAFPGDSANKSNTFTAGNFDNTLTSNTSAGNALFNGLTSAGTFNASILSFQIVPTANTVSLSFVFGSEDYNLLVNSGFPTDVFGVFVNGVNYAFVPGTHTPISASTINCGSAGASGAASGVGAQNCNLYRDNPPFFDAIDTELNGLTTLITLQLPVLSGQVNSISIGIADAFDDSGDSALMLAAGSIQAVPEPASLALVFAGLAALGTRGGRRKSTRGPAMPMPA